MDSPARVGHRNAVIGPVAGSWREPRRRAGLFRFGRERALLGKGLDGDLLEWFCEGILRWGRNSQSLINMALRHFIDSTPEPREKTPRRGIWEELNLVR